MAQFGKMLDEALRDPKLVEGGMSAEEQERMRQCMKDPEFVRLFVDFAKDLKENRESYNFEEMVSAMEALGSAGGAGAAPAGGEAGRAPQPRGRRPSGLPEGIRAQQRRQLEENRSQKRVTAHQRAQAAVVQRNAAALRQSAQAKAAALPTSSGTSQGRPLDAAGDLKALEALLSDVERLKAEVGAIAGQTPATQAGAAPRSEEEDKALDALAAELTAPAPPPARAGGQAPPVEVVESPLPAAQPAASTASASAAASSSLPAPADILALPGAPDGSLLPPKPRVPESCVTYVQDADYGDFIEGERMNVSAIRGYSKVRLDVALQDDTDIKDIDLSVDGQFVTVEYPGYSLHQPLLLKVQAARASAKVRKAPGGGLCRQFASPTRRYLEVTLPLEKNDADALLRAREAIELINSRNGGAEAAAGEAGTPHGLPEPSAFPDSPAAALSSHPDLPDLPPPQREAPRASPEPPRAPFTANPEVLAKAKEWKTSKPAQQRMAAALADPARLASSQPAAQGKGLTDILREKQKREDPEAILARLEAVDAAIREKYPKLQSSSPLCFDVRGKVFSLLNPDLSAPYAPEGVSTGVLSSAVAQGSLGVADAAGGSPDSGSTEILSSAPSPAPAEQDSEL